MSDNSDGEMEDTKISLDQILNLLEGPLSEPQIWAVMIQILKRFRDDYFVNTGWVDLMDVTCSPGTLFLSSDGKVELCEDETTDKSEDYLAPECLDMNPRSETDCEKMFIYAIGGSMYSSADYNLGEDEEPDLSEDLEQLMESMTDEDKRKRPKFSDALVVCGRQEIDAKSILSDLFHEVCNMQAVMEKFLKGKKPPKSTEKKPTSFLNNGKLLDEIRDGKELKKVSEADKKKIQRDAETPHEKLLSSIQKRKKTEHEEEEDQKKNRPEEYTNPELRATRNVIKSDIRLQPQPQPQVKKKPPVSPKTALTAEGIKVDLLNDVVGDSDDGDEKANEAVSKGRKSPGGNQRSMANRRTTRKSVRKKNSNFNTLNLRGGSMRATSPTAMKKSASAYDNKSTTSSPTTNSEQHPKASRTPSGRRLSDTTNNDSIIRGMTRSHTMAATLNDTVSSSAPGSKRSSKSNIAKIGIPEMRHIGKVFRQAVLSDIKQEDPVLYNKITSKKICWLCKRTEYGYIFSKGKDCYLCLFPACGNCRVVTDVGNVQDQTVCNNCNEQVLISHSNNR